MDKDKIPGGTAQILLQVMMTPSMAMTMITILLVRLFYLPRLHLISSIVLQTTSTQIQISINYNIIVLLCFFICTRTFWTEMSFSF